MLSCSSAWVSLGQPGSGVNVKSVFSVSSVRPGDLTQIHVSGHHQLTRATCRDIQIHVRYIWNGFLKTNLDSLNRRTDFLLIFWRDYEGESVSDACCVVWRAGDLLGDIPLLSHSFVIIVTRDDAWVNAQFRCITILHGTLKSWACDVHDALSLLHIKIELLKMKAIIKHSLYSKKSANVWKF